MARSPETWRRIVMVCGVLGLLLVVAGYTALHEMAREYRTPGLLAFYAGFALVIAAIVLWYRYVPPRPPAPEEPEQVEESNNPDPE